MSVFAHLVSRTRESASEGETESRKCSFFSPKGACCSDYVTVRGDSKRTDVGVFATGCVGSRGKEGEDAECRLAVIGEGNV
jgi:hypothetical protein